MTALLLAILPILLPPLLGLLIGRYQRTHAPTPEQIAFDRSRDITAIQQQMVRARAAGDDATADALLRRLLELTPVDPGVSPSGTFGERGAGDPAPGHTDPPAK